MAKTLTTTSKFKIVDLIRYKNPNSMIEVPKYPVEVVIEVTTTAKIGKPKEVPSTKMKRLEDAARTSLDRYEKIITEELKKFDDKIAKAVMPGTKAALKEAKEIAKTTTVMVKNALDSAKGAAEIAVEKTLKKEAQGDKLLTQARVKTGIKIATGVIKIGTSVAKLVATVGADVTSYVSIAKTIYDLGSEIQQQLKGEEKLRKDLNSGVKAFMSLRESTITQAAKRSGVTDLSGIDIKLPMVAIKGIIKKAVATTSEVTKGKSAKEIGATLLSFVIKGIKSKLKDVEKARVAYRNHVTKMRQKVDKVGVEADKLMKLMKKATNLKDGVKIGAECMQVKGKARRLSEKFDASDKHLAEMQNLMKANGLEIDDRTIIDKLKAFDKSTMFSEGKDLVSGIKTVYSFVSKFAELAA